MDYKQKLNDLLLTTARQNASDLHLAVGRHPTLRIDSVLIPLSKEPLLTPETANNLIFSLLTPEQKDIFYGKKKLIFLTALKTRLVFG